MTQQKKKKKKENQEPKLIFLHPQLKYKLQWKKTTAPSMQTAQGMESIPKGSSA